MLRKGPARQETYARQDFLLKENGFEVLVVAAILFLEESAARQNLRSAEPKSALSGTRHL